MVALHPRLSARLLVASGLCGFVLVYGTCLLASEPAEALISLSANPVVLSALQPGGTSAGTGTLTATDTSGIWTLQAMDGGSGAGHLVAAATGCTGSASQLVNPLKLSVSGLVTGATSAGTIDLSGTNQTVASSTNPLAVLSGSPLTTNYSVTVPPDEVLLAGCSYSLTVTFTLQ